MEKVKSLRRAKELNLKEAEKWIRVNLYPKRRTKGIEIKGRLFYREDQCEYVYSRNFFEKEKNLIVKKRAKPVGSKHTSSFGKSMYYDVYRISDTIPKKQIVRIQPKNLDDLLLALFVVNRSTKRRRDAATRAYSSRNHGQAGYQKRIKEELYSLKDLGLKIAIKLKLVEYKGNYGELATYIGNGYCFHSPNILPPASEQYQISEEDDYLWVESKPKGSKEPKLKDAKFTINEFIKNGKEPYG